MRADETSWPYHNPGGDEPDWAAGDGHPSWPANGNGQDWTAGDDNWPANGNGQDWTAGDDSWPVNGNGNRQDWPYGEDHPSYPAGVIGVVVSQDDIGNRVRLDAQLVQARDN